MKIKLAVVLMAGFCLPLQAEINISGFASINAGKVISGSGVPDYGMEPTFVADYPNVSTYTEEWSMAPETLLGLQFTADVYDGLSATAQVLARGADDFNVTMEWAYLSYKVANNWTVQAGRKRLPLFYYSDFFDVGYAYVWMRPPENNYGWEIFNYNGANVLYNNSFGDWSLATNIYAGREDDKENKLLTDFFYAGTPTRVVWDNIVGGVASTSYEWFEARITYMQYTAKMYQGGEVLPGVSGILESDNKFYGLAINLDFDSFFILTELNRLDSEDFGKNDTMMATLGYRISDFTPYLGYSSFENEVAGDEKHNTSSAGIRWDFHPSAAFKVQYDEVKDESEFLPVAGDSKSLTLGVDLVF